MEFEIISDENSWHYFYRKADIYLNDKIETKQHKQNIKKIKPYLTL